MDSRVGARRATSAIDPDSRAPSPRLGWRSAPTRVAFCPDSPRKTDDSRPETDDSRGSGLVGVAGLADVEQPVAPLEGVDRGGVDPIEVVAADDPEDDVGQVTG